MQPFHRSFSFLDVNSKLDFPSKSDVTFAFAQCEWALRLNYTGAKVLFVLCRYPI